MSARQNFVKTFVLGVKINPLGKKVALEIICNHIRESKRLWVVTPNPEFLVTAQKNAEFKETLNNADLAIPDGQGLIWASKILGTSPGVEERVAGADLTEQLLVEAGNKGWNVGIVGARRGDKRETYTTIKNLKLTLRRSLSRAKSRDSGQANSPSTSLRASEFQIQAQELTRGWEKKRFDIIFACQGMGEQERWIFENKDKINASVFMGIGGSLDFLTGFSKRAPEWMRERGLEWIWRLFQNPKKHWRRAWNACVVFSWLVLKEKVRKLT